MKKAMSNAARRFRVLVRGKRNGKTEEQTVSEGENSLPDPGDSCVDGPNQEKGGISGCERDPRSPKPSVSIIITDTVSSEDGLQDVEDNSDTACATPNILMTPATSPAHSESNPSSDEEAGAMALQAVETTPCEELVPLNTCGDLERILDASSLPVSLKDEIYSIRNELLWEYSPHYDFCVIASDEDYDLSVQFRDYLTKTYRLIGCTLYDGFITLGADMFDCYEKMMDQSHKAFFLVTKNFSQNAFCRRLQSGAVFQCLMSKIKVDREKCVPVYPYGICKAPLALSGVSGLLPSRNEMMRRVMMNTYSPLVREQRALHDITKYEQRCLEFQKRVMLCIEEYRANNALEEASSPLQLQDLIENPLAIQDRRPGILPPPHAGSGTPFIPREIDAPNKNIITQKMQNESSSRQNNIPALNAPGDLPLPENKNVLETIKREIETISRSNNTQTTTNQLKSGEKKNSPIQTKDVKSSPVYPSPAHNEASQNTHSDLTAEYTDKCNKHSGAQKINTQKAEGGDTSNRGKVSSESSDDSDIDNEKEENDKDDNNGSDGMDELPKLIGEALKSAEIGNKPATLVNIKNSETVTVGNTINIVVNYTQSENVANRYSPKQHFPRKSSNSDSE